MADLVKRLDSAELLSVIVVQLILMVDVLEEAARLLGSLSFVGLELGEIRLRRCQLRLLQGEGLMDLLVLLEDCSLVVIS